MSVQQQQQQQQQQLNQSSSSSIRKNNKTSNGINSTNNIDPSSSSSYSSSSQQLRLLRTGICHSQQMLKHWKPGTTFDPTKDQDDDDHEPERPSRISRIMARVSKEKLIGNLENIKIRQATKEEIMLVHSEGHWNRIYETSFMSTQDLKDRSSYFSRLSLYVNADTFDCARLSCGGVIEMCRSVVEGRIRNGFAVVRPPGHHSEPEDPSGFCVFNNAAVAAKWLRTIYPEKIKKILLIDWDVHHGNGTQRSFYFDSSVLYISIHRYLENNRTTYFYPGSDWGGSNRVGEGDGRGFNVNIPWPDPGMGDQDYIYAFQRLVMPIAMEFNPDFVIVSAGFDAAKNDPLGECEVTPEGFAHMTHMISSLANGNVVLALEGGYHLESLALSATECIKVLMGESPARVERGLIASETATETVDEVLRIQSEFWKSLPRGVTTKNEVLINGINTPLGEILKMHRSYDLYKSYGLCSIPMKDHCPVSLSYSFQNQVMVSENVYECDTLVLFLHDLGHIRNEVFSEPTSLEEENEKILDCNRLIMDWINKNNFGVVDVMILPSNISDLASGGLVKKVEQNKVTRQLISWIWNNFISLSDCEKLILMCVGESCNFLPMIISLKDISNKLVSTIQVPNLRYIPPKLNSELDWHHDISATLLPIHNNKKNFYDKLPNGLVKFTDKARPTQVILSEWKSIVQFVERSLDRFKSKKNKTDDRKDEDDEDENIKGNNNSNGNVNVNKEKGTIENFERWKRRNDNSNNNDNDTEVISLEGSKDSEKINEDIDLNQNSNNSDKDGGRDWNNGMDID